MYICHKNCGMFPFSDSQPETFVDEANGTRLTLSGLTINGKTKAITVEITDKEGRRSVVTINSRHDIRRFLDLFGAIPVPPIVAACSIPTFSTSTAPSYRKTGIGVYLFYEDNERSECNMDYQEESILDLDYEGLCEYFGKTPDAFALFFWYDGSIGKDAIKSVIAFCLNYQRDFVLTGDPMKCRRMTLDIVARKTGVNLTSVSRCTSSRRDSDGEPSARETVRIFTPHTIFNLDNHKCSLEEPSLFDDGIPDSRQDSESRYVSRNGQEVSRLQVLAILRDLIANEDKNHPYSDENLSVILTNMGYPIQRRTVAKYREEFLGLPSSSRRKTTNPT